MIQIDMPMPENCRMCPVCSEYDICLIPVDGKGFGEQNVSEFTGGRPEWCPMKEQEAKPPVHIHEEYTEHDWERKENGDIDDFAWDAGYHNGPVCKRCYYSFCVFCNPHGWNKKQCIIDTYKCPKCGMYISKGTEFCSDCGQEVKWDA